MRSRVGVAMVELWCVFSLTVEPTTMLEVYEGIAVSRERLLKLERSKWRGFGGLVDWMGAVTEHSRLGLPRHNQDGEMALGEFRSITTGIWQDASWMQVVQKCNGMKSQCLKERRMCEDRREGVGIEREGDSEDVDGEREYVCVDVGEDCVASDGSRSRNSSSNNNNTTRSAVRLRRPLRITTSTTTTVPRYHPTAPRTNARQGERHQRTRTRSQAAVDRIQASGPKHACDDAAQYSVVPGSEERPGQKP